MNQPKKSSFLFSAFLFSCSIFSCTSCGGGGSSGNQTSSVIQTASSSVASSLVASSAAGSSQITSSQVSSQNTSSTQASSAAAWQLVWSDEFNGNSLDMTQWSFEQNCVGGGNNELECYTGRTANTSVSGGDLHIIAAHETFSGQSKWDDDSSYDINDKSITKNYTSARIRTKLKGDWKFGRIEVRAKMPQGQGMWPAIWMMPTDNFYGAWAASGEIDIFEAINSNRTGNDNKIYGTLHYGGAWPNNASTGDHMSPATNIWDNFHTYALEWEDGEMRWYVDDVHYLTQTKNGWYTQYSSNGVLVKGTGAAPFDKRFYLILNLAVGGDWPGSPNGTTVFPQEMTVDYVRIYSCSSGLATGKGCASHVDPSIVPKTTTPQ